MDGAPDGHIGAGGAASRVYRHEFVADAVVSGLMAVQVEPGVPIICMVLAPQRFHKHEEQHRFFYDHFLIKGSETAFALLETIEALRCVCRLASIG